MTRGTEEHGAAGPTGQEQALEEALEHLARAVSRLEGAVVGHEHQQTSNATLTEDIAMLREDRSRLAGRIDDLQAVRRRQDARAGAAAARLAQVMESIRSALEPARKGA